MPVLSQWTLWQSWNHTEKALAPSHPTVLSLLCGGNTASRCHLWDLGFLLPHMGFSSTEGGRKTEETSIFEPGIMLCTYVFYLTFTLQQAHEGGIVTLFLCSRISVLREIKQIIQGRKFIVAELALISITLILGPLLFPTHHVTFKCTYLTRPIFQYFCLDEWER